MEIEISEDASKKIGQISTALGLEKREIVDRAILFYLDNIQKSLQIKKEFEMWDSLSDEALINFEKQL